MKFQIETNRALQPSIGRSRKGPTDSEKVELAQAIEDGLMKSGNYVSVFRTGQGKWKPLTPKYVARKARRGFSTKTWMLTGDTFEAMTTRIAISGKTSTNFYGRFLTLKSIPKSMFRATIEYKIKAPAASGWPGRRKNKSYFAKNDRIRPFLTEITQPGEDAVFSEMIDVVMRYYDRIFR